MTPRQRRKRRIVARLVWQNRLHNTMMKLIAANRRFSAAMAEVYRQAREKQT